MAGSTSGSAARVADRERVIERRAVIAQQRQQRVAAATEPGPDERVGDVDGAVLGGLEDPGERLGLLDDVAQALRSAMAGPAVARGEREALTNGL